MPSYLDGGADERVGGEGAREAKVAELGAAVGVDEDVVRLEVPVEDAAAVEEEEGRQQVHHDLQNSAT